MKRLLVQHEKPIYGTNVGISVRTHWRNLPPILFKLKFHECSIQKAKYWEEWTTMYIKTPKKQDYDFIADLIHSSADEEYNRYSTILYPAGLPYNTCIYMYNISTLPYTVLDFGCVDRTGLFCEIIELLGKYDIDIKGAYINTVGNVVTNIFYITHNDKKLSDEYIEYVRNNLESGVRSKHYDSY
jgi:hypothetical protein